jgi:oxygen-independent coproporphyrinogen-3 oxidase
VQPFEDHLAARLDEVTGRPVGLYLHVPFCVRRCGYCAFTTEALPATSEEAHGGSVVAGYVDSMISELRLLGESLAEHLPPLRSLYLGGGTPTAIGAGSLSTLIDAAREALPIDPSAEVTVEANPEGLEPSAVAQLVSAGVNRISIGVQSAVPEVLQTLDRTHDPRRIRETVASARAAGVASISVDLIHGTPGESPADWRSTLELAISAGVDHVSCYALSVEPSTKLAARVRSGRLPAPDPDVAAENYLLADELLGREGFEWYELSNWARLPEDRSAHNLLYWRNHNWLGVGPGAHSHLAGLRWWNHRDRNLWRGDLDAGALPAEGYEQVGAESRRLEQVMLGMRLREGLPLADLDPDGVAEVVVAGWARENSGRLQLTLGGRLLADEVVRRLA